MSCTICRLPFVPGPRATSPFPEHYPPHEVMSRSSSLYSYFTGATGIGCPDIHTLKAKYDYVSMNMFTGFDGTNVLCVLWETPDIGGTAFMMHTGCANLFLHRMDVGMETLERATLLSEVAGVLGRPMDGKNAGRLPDVKYEAVGEKINLNRFWHAGPPGELGGNIFDWKALSKSPYAFLINKPNVFPRFFNEVAPSRLANLCGPGVEFTNADTFTTLPIDILGTITPHLDTPAYISLTSTCRLLRLHALTTFQPHARLLVLRLPWALPVPTELSEMSPASIAKLPHRDPKKTPYDADWYLYLSHVHRTDSMRVRRWVWALLDEIHGVYGRKRMGSKAMEVGTARWREVHGKIQVAWNRGVESEKVLKARAKAEAAKAKARK